MVQDIQDGEAYKEHQKPGGFFTVRENTGLILCCDGVQLFKSSTQAFWPILLAATSLPPGIRINAENLILAGVWQGHTKPPMNIILGQVLDKLEHINTHGIPFNFNGPKLIRAKLLVCVFDLPARASATNFVQFNGYYSCLYCTVEGKHTSHKHIFLPDEHHQPRSKHSIKKNVEDAEKQGSTVMGVKGKSVLSSSVDIVEAVPVDYMHGVLEGVARRLLSAYVDSKNHMHCYYLGRVTEEIDKRLKQIKPPQEFRRSPRSVCSMKQWKAAEFRAWLLYYCLPVLSDLLPPKYIYHLSLLVSTMHILLGDMIPVGDVDKAQKMLELFYELTPQLYGEEICTANMHILIHLSQCVKNWGPLWGYSCFGFESMNGHLRKSCHGTGYVLPQLVHNVRMRQLLPIKANKIASSANSNVASFIHSLAGVTEKADELEIKSRIVHKKLNELITDALKSAGFLDLTVTQANLPVCEKIRYKSVIYSIAPKEEHCRDGSTCVFSYQSQLKFGSIIQFCYCSEILIAVINVFECLDRTIWDNIRPSTHPKLNRLCCNSITEFVYCVKKLSVTLNYVAVPASCIFVKCIHIPTKHTLFDYITTIPNMFEHH